MLGRQVMDSNAPRADDGGSGTETGDELQRGEEEEDEEQDQVCCARSWALHLAGNLGY